MFMFPLIFQVLMVDTDLEEDEGHRIALHLDEEINLQ